MPWRRDEMDPRSAASVRPASSSLDLLAILALALLGAAAGIAPVETWVRAVFALPLIFVLPGLALVAALLGTGRLDRAETVAYSLSLSVAISALAGVVIQLVLDLDRTAWVVSLAAITVLLTVAAYIGGGGRRDPEQSEQGSSFALPSAGSMLLVVAACAMAAGAS